MGEGALESSLLEYWNVCCLCASYPGGYTISIANLSFKNVFAIQISLVSLNV